MLLGEVLEAPERLMNSRSGRIHLFPVVPDWTECSFRDFMARGGFCLSAIRSAKGVEGDVTVKASRSIPCRLMNPWVGQAVQVTDAGSGEKVAVAVDKSNGECLVLEAQAGHTYSVALAK